MHYKLVSLGTASFLAIAFMVLGPLAPIACGQSRPAGPAEQNVTATMPVVGSATKQAANLTLQVAHIRVTGQIEDAPIEFSFFGDSSRSLTLRDCLNRLAIARQDDQVAAVALELDDLNLSWAQSQELSDAISRLNQIKPVYAFFASAGISQYLVASAAKEVAMEPSGGLDIVGLASEMMFFRGTLDWIGVQPQMVQIGRYKGAAEPMMRKEPTPEMLQEHQKIIDNLYTQLCSQVARQRNMTPAEVAAAIDQGPFWATEAQRLKLVDHVVERSQWQQHVQKRVAPYSGTASWRGNYGKTEKQPLDFSSPFAFLASIIKRSEPQEIKSPTVAIVHVQGMIVSGTNSQGLMGQRLAGDKTLVATIKQVAADPRIKAMVLRIDSPGGSALASELIYQAVRDCAAKKPVIASICGLGASGGYYIALGAPTIYADGASIVGSIGVVSGKMAITEMLGKIGITTHSLTRGKNAGLELSRAWTPEELNIIQSMAQRTYDQFVSRVTQSRGNRITNVQDVAQGRIFTAEQAVKNGIIDKTGGLRDAVEAARAAAGIETSDLISLPKTKSLPDLLVDSDEDAIMPGFSKSFMATGLGKPSAGTIYMINLSRMLSPRSPLLAMPYYLDIHE